MLFFIKLSPKNANFQGEKCKICYFPLKMAKYVVFQEIEEICEKICFM